MTIELNKILELKTKFFVDIGASCYTNDSQSEILLEHAWSGIMFECDINKYNIQKEKMTNKNVCVLPNKVTPANILDLLINNNAPKDFYLSLDIDGYDFYVLEKILTKYEPQLIISEINEKIPPTVKFTVNYDKDYFWDGSHYYGYSLFMLEDLLLKYKYKIDYLDWNNVVLIPGEQKENFSEIYNNGYLNRKNRNEKFYYNSDFEMIHNLSKKEQLGFINEKFKEIKGFQLDGLEVKYRNYFIE